MLRALTAAALVCSALPSMAQLAQMSTEAFEDFCLSVSSLDYARMDRAMDPLVDLMARTDRVRIVGPETDLRFSIEAIPVVKAAGKNCVVVDAEPA